MSEMLERAARALCENHGLDWTEQADPQTNANGSDDARQGYYDDVRAVLRALMKPTPEMLGNVGPMEGFDCDLFYEDIDRCHIEWWQAMITAALGEDGE